MSAEPESLREQQRHAEERVSQLRADNASLEQRLSRSPASFARSAVYVAAAGLAGTLGFVLTNRTVDVSSLDPGTSFIAHESTLGLDEETAKCGESREVTRSKLSTCRRELASQPTPPCHCEPGDPLCACF